MKPKVSKIFLTFLAIVLFTDPFIFFRAIFGNDILVFISILLIVITIIIYNKNNYSSTTSINISKKFLFFLIFYSVWSVTVRVYAKVSLTDISIFLKYILSIFLIYYYFIKKKHVEVLINAYIIAGILHFSGVLPISFIQERLAQYTAYQIDQYSIGIFTKRATGFFPSPGYLIVYSTGLIMIGLSKLVNNKKGWSIVLLGVFLGFSTLNRSFLIVILLIFIFILFKLKKASLKILLYVVLAFILGSLLFYDKILIFYQLYAEYLDARFEGQTISENDRVFGPTGILESLNAISNYPFFGNAVSVNGGSLQVWNGNMLIQPHNSILLFCTFYGLILGFPFILNIIKFLFYCIVDLLKKGVDYDYTFIFGFVNVFIICMIEPLFESSIFAFFYIGLQFQLLTNKKNFILNYE